MDAFTAFFPLVLLLVVALVGIGLCRRRPNYSLKPYQRRSARRKRRTSGHRQARALAQFYFGFNRILNPAQRLTQLTPMLTQWMRENEDDL